VSGNQGKDAIVRACREHHLQRTSATRPRAGRIRIRTIPGWRCWSDPARARRLAFSHSGRNSHQDAARCCAFPCRSTGVGCRTGGSSARI